MENTVSLSLGNLHLEVSSYLPSREGEAFLLSRVLCDEDGFWCHHGEERGTWAGTLVLPPHPSLRVVSPLSCSRREGLLAPCVWVHL